MVDMRHRKHGGRAFAPRSGRASAALLALLVGLAGAVFAASGPGRQLEQDIGLAQLYALRGPRVPPPDVVLVAMDRRSTDGLGISSSYSDWPRRLHRALIERLVRDGASVIAFDVFFKNRRGAAEDRALASAVRASKRVVLVESTDRVTIPRNRSALPAAIAIAVRSPVGRIADAARGYGPFPLPRVPARVDQLWTYMSASGGRPTLPVVALQTLALQDVAEFRRVAARLGPGPQAALEAYLASPGRAADLGALMGAMRRAVKGTPRTGWSRAIAGTPPALQRRLAALLRAYAGPDSYFANFYGPPGTIRTIPYAAALDRPAGGLDLHGKIVLVGVADSDRPNDTDGYDTVYSRGDGVELSGVEIAGTALANLLDGTAIRQLGTGALFLVVMAFGILAAGVAHWGRSALSLGATVLVGVAYTATARYAFAQHALWLPLTAPLLLQLPAAILAGALVRYVRSRREGENVLTGVRAFLPENAAAMLRSGRKPAPSSEILHGVCMFTDLENYTAATEALSLDNLALTSSAYFRLVSEAIGAHGGNVIGYAGDGVVGTWDARTFDDATEMRHEACLAALDARRSLEGYAFDPQGDRLRARIGLHEGDFLSGFFGGHQLLDHAVLGDTINTASRIETLNKHLGTQILMSGCMIDGLDDILFRRLGQFRLAGKSEVLPICEVIERRSACDRAQHDLCDRFDALVDAFEAERWHDAAAAAEQIMRAYPADRAARFLFRIASDRDACRSVDTGPIIVMDHK